MISLRRLVLALAVAVAAGCGDDNGTTAPQTGTLAITTTTTGDPGQDYTVIVDGASPRTIAANATLTIAEMEVGTHLIQLTLPATCSVEAENPRSVNVTANATATVAFAVTCGAPST